MSDENKTVDTKKGRKPFEWTEARKAAFERCKKAREERIVHKAKLQKEGKVVVDDKKKKVANLLKNAELLKKLLEGMEIPVHVPDEPKEEPKKEDKEVKQVKKIKKVAKPPPPPVEESSEEEEEEEEEEEPPPPPPRKPVNTFRYTNNSSSRQVPKAPLPSTKPHSGAFAAEVKKKSPFLFL